MIHHISIAADNPLRVAQVLAELLNGEIVPFPSNPGSYVALAFDAYGTLIEVHPRGLELRPGIGKNAVQHQTNPYPSAYTATHVAISTLASEAEIRSIAAREGWRVERYKRGDAFFEVIEFWIENHLLLELLPPELSAQYLAFLEPRSLKEFLATTS
jgi:FMN phosphatase YigB (HAD superfamily)